MEDAASDKNLLLEPIKQNAATTAKISKGKLYVPWRTCSAYKFDPQTRHTPRGDYDYVFYKNVPGLMLSGSGGDFIARKYNPACFGFVLLVGEEKIFVVSHIFHANFEEMKMKREEKEEEEVI